MRFVTAFLSIACLTAALNAQDFYQRPSLDTINAGVTIPVRTTASIHTDKSNGRVFPATVDEDVTAINGDILVPKGAAAELIVKNIHGMLALDLDAVSMNGHRYAFAAEEKGIMLATLQTELPGGRNTATGRSSPISLKGQSIKVPKNSLLMFRLQEPLKEGAGDPGYMRDGIHYHSGYGNENEHTRAKPRGRQ